MQPSAPRAAPDHPWTG